MSDYHKNYSQDEQIYPKIKDEILTNERRDENVYLDNVKKMVEQLIGPRKEDISSSQLRNVFSRVRKMKEPKELYLLRPKLAYIYGRPNSKDGMKKLIIILDELIPKVDNKDKLEKFKSFFEAIIAYHKFYGGSN